MATGEGKAVLRKGIWRDGKGVGTREGRERRGIGTGGELDLQK